MADKKKMSVAEMLAAARQADGGGDAPAATPAKEQPAKKQAVAAPEPAQAKSPESKPAKATPAKVGGGGRLSVAEMLAAARGGGGAAAKPAEKKPAPKPAAAAKPIVAKKQAEAAPSEPRDTASILAASRKSSHAGPMSKAEAAAKEKADLVTKAKPQIIVPPMPAKPAYAQAKTAPAKAKEPAEQTRRGFLNLGYWNLAAVGALWTLASVKFMFPNVRREPPSKFKVGFPDAFPAGQVQTKYKAQFGVWVVNTEVNGQQEIFALKSVCTHLGCTPNWLEAEQKFKCPCHGSGFYKDGINFEGPAPRPLERFAIRVADDGQIEIDKSRTFQEEMGQWEEPSSFIPV